MNNIETYNIKERFPVGDKGVVLLEYPTLPKRFAICLYDQRNPDELLGRVPETSEQAAYRIYLERCDTLVEQLEQKTGIQFPLPATCMAALTSTGDLVNIRRGMTGYYPSDWNVPGDRKRNEDTAAFHNAQYELTKAQCAAMVCGSMFGWDVPGANPAIPNLVLDPEPTGSIGKYGRMRKRYLEEKKDGTLTALVLSGKLTQHLLEIDNLCREQIETLTRKMVQAEGVTEQLKATDQMAWVQRMNSIKSRAEEIVTAELIYN